MAEERDDDSRFFHLPLNSVGNDGAHASIDSRQNNFVHRPSEEVSVALRPRETTLSHQPPQPSRNSSSMIHSPPESVHNVTANGDIVHLDP